VLLAAMVACGPSGGNKAAVSSPTPVAASPTAHASPTAQPTTNPTPQPVTGAFGVLYSSQSSSDYTVSIVAIDGKVVASASASTPPPASCANTAAAVVSPPLSMSNSRAYFMDGQGAVHFLGPGGDTGRATTLPVSSALLTVCRLAVRVSVIRPCAGMGPPLSPETAVVPAWTSTLACLAGLPTKMSPLT